MNYEEMSDTEIEILVWKATDCYTDVALDYCSDPSDAWPIIFKHKIHTGWAGGTLWRAEITNQGMPGEFRREISNHANPLRAAMIVYLKMQEQQQ